MLFAAKCRTTYEEAKKRRKYSFEERQILRIVAKEIKRQSKRGKCEYKLPYMMFPESREMIIEYLRNEGFTVSNDGYVLL